EAREQADALQNARTVHQAVWQRLAGLVGQPDMPVAAVLGDLEQCCALPGPDVTWAHLVEASPELRAARSEVARRQAALRASLSGAPAKPCDGDKTAADGMLAQALARMSGPFTNREPQVKQAAWTDLARSEAAVGRVEQMLRQRLTDAYARLDRAKDVAD